MSSLGSSPVTFPTPRKGLHSWDMVSPETTSINPSVPVPTSPQPPPPTLNAAEQKSTYIRHGVIASCSHDAELLHIRVVFQGFCICLEGRDGDILQRERQVVAGSPRQGQDGQADGR